MASGYLMRDYYDMNGEIVQRSIYKPHGHSAGNFEHSSQSNDNQIAHQKALDSARRRAFSLASLKLLSNPDMTCFVTLTYDPKKNSDPDYLNDLKNLFRNTGTKYIATFERHKKKNPLLHIHIICTPTLDFYTNEHGYLSVTKWHKGFSSVRMLSDFDDRFRASKYVFKYMVKSEKVKHKYVYSSRNLINPPVYTDVPSDNPYFINSLMDGFQYQVGVLNLKYQVIKGVKYE